MNGAEALMWTLDADPALRSSFLGITLLDAPPDPARLRDRIAEAVASNPIMSQRVVTAPFDIANPRWEPDPAFDLDYHLRHVALPPPGTRRQLLDMAALLYADPWDRSRPLWRFTVVEGLADGGAALLAKMHHVISDGIGAVRLSVSFLDLSPHGDAIPAAPAPAPPADPPSRNLLSVVAGTIGGVLNAPATARSLGKQLAVVDRARSPLWQHRSYVHRFDLVSIDLGRTRAVAKRLGGTVNDAYVTMIAEAAGAYHRALGEPVDELRMAMPISVRHDRAVGGNAWVPSRLLVPTGEMDPAKRFAQIHDRIAAVRSEPSSGAALAEPIAAVVRHVPSPVLLRFAHQQTGTVDFACSNVRGAPFDLWISGAHVEGNHPMGPTAGAAFNATVLSYRDSLDLGLNCDTGAIADPDLLRSCIEEAAAAVLASA
jgi:diacylglycerol O-acyltransferase